MYTYNVAFLCEIIYAYCVCLGLEGELMGKVFFKKQKRENMLNKLFKNISLSSEKKEKIVNFFNRTSLIWHMVLAVFLCLFIESCSRHSITAAFTFLKETPWIFLYNSLIIYVTFFVVYLFRKRIALRVTLSVVWCFLGIINGCILAKRVTPFSYTDLKLIGDLFAMNSTYFTATECVLVIILVAIVIALNVLLYIKAPKFKGKINKLISLTVIGSCFMWLPMVTEAAVNKEVLSTYFENIALGYEEYGFVYGFSTSVVGTGMSKPANYSEEIIVEIQDSIQVNETAEMDKMPNIIVVLLESFIDPTEVNYLNIEGEPIPNFRYLEENFTTGYMTVPVVGAGTANTEFEVLTGMSMRFFGTGEYPYKTILKETDCESIAGNLGKLGYSTHVVHNNTAKFYSRNNAFSMMGFDSFVSKEFMIVDEYNTLGTWAADNLLLEQIDKVMNKSENQQDLVYCITVQGHGAYPTEPVFENPEFKVTGAPTDELNYSWEYYVNELHYVDEFIGNLVAQMEARDEETMIVLWGDHLPTMGLNESDMASESTFKTKYVTWNNFGLPKKDADLTAYQLLAYVTGQANIHEGTIFKYHQDYLNAGYAIDNDIYLNGLENLQYDLLYGNRYSYAGEDLYPASDLELGANDIIIDSVAVIGKGLYVYGENFTAWTKVHINGEKCATKFISPQCLGVSLNKYEIADGDIINANVVGSGTILRASEDYIFTQYVEDENNPSMIANEALSDYLIEEDLVLHELVSEETEETEDESVEIEITE